MTRWPTLLCLLLAVSAFAHAPPPTAFSAYNTPNRLTNLVAGTPSAALASFAYRLGPAGHRTNLVETIGGVGRAFTWSYDALYRLTNEVLSGAAPTGTISCRYDAVGNRTNRTSTVSGVPNQTFAYTANDWLSTDVYDANGNTRTNGASVFFYDVENRLTNATVGGVSVSYTYNANGIRVRKSSGGVTTLYLVDDRNPTGFAQVLEELAVSGGTTNLTKVYTYGQDLIAQRIVSSGQRSFYGYDGNGNTRYLTGTNAAITDTYVYDAFGTLLASTGSTANDYLFTGEQYDGSLGLYYLRARYLNAGTGRFWTRDTHPGNNQEPLSLHRYLYCHANPVNNIDPSGHENMPSLLTAINVMSQQAAAYIAAVPAYARLAYGAGGAALGRFIQQFGPTVQQFGNQVISLFPRIESMRPALEGFSRRPDFFLRAGDSLRVIEGKYQLPRAGEALTRMGSQVQQFTQWASQGANREVVVWALKSPQNAAQAEQAVLQAAGNPQGVRFVYGVEGLFQYLAHWLGM